MKTVSYTSRSIIHFSTHALVSALFLLATIFISEFVQSKRAELLLGNVRAVLRDDQVAGNATILGRRFADLESLKVLHCLKISSAELGQFFDTTFKENCKSREHFYFINSLVRSDLQSVSGQRYKVEFKVLPAQSESLYLVLLRILGLVLINAVGLSFWLSIRRKELKIANDERNRAQLVEQVAVQSEQIAHLRIEGAVQASLTKLSIQVAHDIRAPLGAISVVAAAKHLTDEHRQLVV
ncbi:MAG: hypothetical protein EOP06_08800, partial [Proteobacteria bacterium]